MVWPAMILGTAWLIRRVRRLKTKAEATSSARPFVVLLALVAIVSLCAVGGHYLPDAPLAYFSLPTRAWRLAAGDWSL